MNSIDEAFKTLRDAGYIIKAWTKEDIESAIEDSHPEFMAQRRDELADRAMETGWWTTLGDCTDQDWNLIDLAISEALNET